MVGVDALFVSRRSRWRIDRRSSESYSASIRSRLRFSAAFEGNSRRDRPSSATEARIILSSLSNFLSIDSLSLSLYLFPIFPTNFHGKQNLEIAKRKDRFVVEIEN